SLAGVSMSPVFSADGRRVATADGSRTMLWDAETGTLLATLNGHQDRVVSAAFNSDGSRLMTASVDKTARVWRISNAWPYHDPAAATLVQRNFFELDVWIANRWRDVWRSFAGGGY